MPLDVSFPAWPPAQLLTGSQQKKKEKREKREKKNNKKTNPNLKDLKLFYSKAHSTNPRLIPPPSACDRKAGELPKNCYGLKSRNLKYLTHLSIFYKLGQPNG